VAEREAGLGKGDERHGERIVWRMRNCRGARDSAPTLLGWDHSFRAMRP
jgi:hypothetical protein